MSRRLSMRNIREVLRLKWHRGLSNRQIAKSCAVARSTVGEYIVKAKEAGLCWPLPEDLDDTAPLKGCYIQCRKHHKGHQRPCLR